MTFAGLKKCVPSTSCGRAVAAAISSTSRVEVLVASSAPGFATRSRSAKTRFLRSISSNTASITTSASAAASSSTAPRDQGDAPLHLLGRQPAARGGRAVIAGNPIEPLLQEIGAGLDEGDRDAGIGKAHRDAAAHRAGADDRGLRDRPRLRSLRDAGDLGRLALGEEDMALRLRLVAGDQLAEQFALAPQAFFKGQHEGVAHRLDAGGRRLPAAQPAGQRGGGRVECAGIGPRRRQLVVAVADAPQRPVFRQNPAGEGDRVRRQIALGERVEDAVGERFGRRDRIAGDDHLERLFRADQPRQALRAAGARQKAELDLGQADPRGRRGHPEMAGKRQLEPTAECGAVHRRDDRLRHCLDRGDDLAQPRSLRRLAELGDVGAGEEGAPGAGDDDRLDCRVVAGLAQRFGEPGAHFVLQRIDRRVVDGDDRDLAVPPEIDARVDVAHAASRPVRVKGCSRNRPPPTRSGERRRA